RNDRKRMSELAEVFTLRSEMTEGAELTKWVLGVCTKYSLPDDVAFALQLCLDEAVAHIIEHGKAHGRGATEISVRIAREDKGIVMKVASTRGARVRRPRQRMEGRPCAAFRKCC